MNKTLFTKIFSALLIVITVLGAIPVTPAYAATSGPNLPDVGNNVNGPGTVNWTNPGNVISDNNVYATVAVNNSTSEYLQATDFDFAIPAGATINGIQVTIGRFGTTGMGQDIQDNVVQLIKGGTLVGNNLGATATDWPNGEAAANYGAANNLWGTTWTPAEINALDFGVALAVDSTNNRTASVDYIQVTVTYSLNSTTVGVATATAGSNSSINVSMPYTDDGDADNTYTVEYCLTSANCPVSGSWTTFVSGAAHSASPFATSITGLSPATSYDVRVTYNDLDGVTGTNPQTLTNVTTLACGSSLTYTAPAGSNRVVVVVVSSESGGGAGAVITGVTIGGTAATQISNLSNNGGSGGTYARLFVGYRVIGTSAVSEAMNIATTNGECIYANTYTGINQTTGTGATNTINSIATGTAASGTTTTSAAVTNQAGGQVVYAINMNGGTADGQVPTGTSTGWTFSELFDRFNNPGGGNMTAIGQSTTTAAGSATISVGDNATDNHNRSVLVGFALNPASATLTLQKTVTNNNGGTAADTAWTLAATGPTNISGVEGNAAVTNAAVATGNYTLNESGGPAGYSTTGIWACSGFTSGSQTDDDTLTLNAGDNVTCVITNDDISPVLTLAKTTTNDNGGTAADTAWTLNAAGPSPISGVEGNAAVTNAAVNAGTYTLTESGGPAGYTQTGLSCSGAADINLADGLTLALGETVTCTFTNNDVSPVLTLAKTTTNDNGGTAADTAWTLNAAGPSPISGAEGAAAVTNAAVNAGTYTLTESGGPSGYTQTGLSCSGAADINLADGLTLVLGETVTCTFTNDDVAPTLTLLKDVVTDNGGTATDTAWTLNATGPTNISGIEGAVAVTNATVNAGNYTLTETGGPAGYTQTGLTCSGAADLNPADGLAIALGETITCTFTNNDVSPVLTLAKTTTNDNGGTAADTVWTLNAAGPSPISGAEGAAAVTNAAVNAGTYTLTESGGPAGYTQTGLSCSGAADLDPTDGLAIALGETITCTFTNDDVAPTLTLLKDVVTDNGGTATDTDWTLNTAGPTPISGAEGDASITSATVDAGNYTLTETGGPSGYTQTGIACTGSDANGADGLTLLPGETVTCTFTNNDVASTLTLVKTVVIDNGGTATDTDWTLNAAGPSPISGVEGVAAVTNAAVNAGSYTLTESGGPSGYTQTNLACSGADDLNPNDGLNIGIGETITCTFTNNDIAPTLTLVKDVTNDDGGTTVIGAWTLSATGPDTISGVTGAGAVTNAVVDAGSYSLGESAITGYTQTAITCSGSDVNGADGLDLDPGENVTCTFFNDDIGGTLTLLKDVVNDNGGLATDTAWTLNATGPTTISGVEGAGAVTIANVSAGSYTLTESGPSGYTQTGLSCSGAADANPNDGLTIALSEVITCTFTNNDVAPTLTLVKNVTNNDGGTAVIGDWTLDASGPSAINGVTGAGTVTNAVVDAGSYSLSETGPTGYTQTAITCSGSDTNGADGLDLDPGENVTCTFFNDDIGATLTLLKDVINDNIGTAIDTDWTLTATGPTTISGVEGTAPVTSAGVSAGNYTLTESGPANYTQTAITCVGGTDANGADGLTLALGETVTCTFLNNDDVPVLLVPNVNSTPDTGDGSIAEGEVILNTLNVSKLTVQFNWDADNPAGITDTDDVNNPNNYILLYSSTGTFNTPSCAVVAGGGVVAPDIRIPVTTVTYNNGGGSGPFIATLNLGTTLTNVGHYRLFVCGTTSIVLAADPTIVLSGNGTPGTDFIRNFQINADPGNGGGGTSREGDDELTVGALPATGFAPGRITALPIQPEELAYTSLGDLWIEIPALGVKSSIVGVPQTKEAEWNVTWLANNVGWLNGTAFPTWEGNSVLTAHVTNADGLAGPFANLTKLKFGDQIIVHAFGQKYIFELRNSRVVKPFSTSFAFEDLEDESYLTLITCQVYLPKSDTYLYRRVLRAVLVRIENE